MVTAIVLAVVVMLTFAGRIAAFVERASDDENARVVVLDSGWRGAGRRRAAHAHPEGLRLLFVAFALGVEMLNLRLRKAPATKSFPPQIPPSSI